jgi:hypothetical protein
VVSTRRGILVVRAARSGTAATKGRSSAGIACIPYSRMYDDDDVVHFYSAHIHTIECSWRLADVLACSQKVSHPEMRLVSTAISCMYTALRVRFGVGVAP